MDLNKKSGQKKMITIELKREIIQKYEQGVRVSDLARQYGRTTSTISTLLKQKEAIKAVTPAKGVTIMSKLRTSIHEEMEKLLIVWMKEKQLKKDALTQGVIREKALAIYSDLLKNAPGTSTKEASEESFKASRGWFDNFKKRTGIHSIVRHGEASSSDVSEGEDYFETFFELLKAKGYVPDQVFNCDEVFWKRAPKRTYVTAEEKAARDHKPTEKSISTSEIKEVLEMWEKVSQFVEKKHPEKDAIGRATELFNDTCLTYFRNILNESTEQSSLDSPFLTPSTGESAASVAKKAKVSEEKNNSYGN